MTGTIERDPLERLAAYRPSSAQLAPEWSPPAVRARIMAAQPGGTLSWRPRRPRRAVSAAVLSAAAVVALIAGILFAVVRPAGQPGGVGAGAPLSLTATRNTPVVGSGQFAQRSMTSYSISADGTASTTAQGTVWASADGALWMNGTVSAAGCVHFPAPSAADFQTPTAAFFDQLPTAPNSLESYMRAHVSGSSSQDEALFVATGDMLRNTDLLASAQLRAAAVDVLSGISGITVHSATTDYLGRPAVRVDWTNQALRPGEVSSLYFDPATFQLLEERTGPSGASSTYSGPSPAYSAHESGASAPPDQLADPATMTVMTSESVVDSVPADVQQCPAE